jgi:hypothetical protein
MVKSTMFLKTSGCPHQPLEPGCEHWVLLAECIRCKVLVHRLGAGDLPRFHHGPLVKLHGMVIGQSWGIPVF